jgi:hypothetical protein
MIEGEKIITKKFVKLVLVVGDPIGVLQDLQF